MSQGSKNNKIEELLLTVDDARRTLQSFQEQRTDAMMSLDVIRANVEQLQEEKRSIEQTLRDIAAEHSVQNDLKQSQIEMLQEENQSLQAYVKTLTDQLSQMQMELQNTKSEFAQKIEILNSENSARLERMNRDHYVAMEAIIKERDDLRAEAMNQDQRYRDLKEEFTQMEKQRDELREVVYEEAILAIKQKQPSALRPRYIMDYLKRVGYEVPED